MFLILAYFLRFKRSGWSVLDRPWSMCWPPVQAWPTSNERSETGRAIPLFKAALQELPQMDSIYAGFENGAWLQVRRTSDLTEEQRERLRAPPNADITINLIRPTAGGDLPLRRIFQDKQGNDIDEIVYGNTATTPASVPDIGRRCGPTVVRDLFKFMPLDAVVAKGMTKETRVFELTGVST